MTRSRLISQFPIQEPTPANRRARNRLLQALPQADFEALRPHLQSVEMVKETVLIEAGAPLTHLYLPESGIISMMVRLSEGQTIELAMIGRDSILGASRCNIIERGRRSAVWLRRRPRHCKLSRSGRSECSLSLPACAA